MDRQKFTDIWTLMICIYPEKHNVMDNRTGRLRPVHKWMFEVKEGDRIIGSWVDSVSVIQLGCGFE